MIGVITSVDNSFLHLIANGSIYFCPHPHQSKHLGLDKHEQRMQNLCQWVCATSN